LPSVKKVCDGKMGVLCELDLPNVRAQSPAPRG